MEEARAEVVAALKARHETWVRAWGHLDRESNHGTERGKLTVGQLSRALQRVKVGLPAGLAAKLAKSADESGDGAVIYTGFLRLCEGDKADKADRGADEELKWSPELEEEIRQARIPPVPRPFSALARSAAVLPGARARTRRAQRTKTGRRFSRASSTRWASRSGPSTRTGTGRCRGRR